LREDRAVSDNLVIDDLSREFPESAHGAIWRLFTDQVMGGVSRGRLRREEFQGRAAIRMQGDVSLENNGGFIQMALPLAEDGAFDASAWRGIAIDVAGAPGAYELRLRTTELARPWESYRHAIAVSPQWSTQRLRFADFTPHRTGVPLNLRKLRRLGLVAIGEAFTADLALGGIRFFA
jgi:hypothetical protein